jgi:SdrD B-like domain
MKQLLNLKRSKYTISMVLFLLTYSTSINAQISGIVFRDFNANGVKNNSATFNEPFLAGITITAYNSAGTTVGTTTTAANGTYSFTGLTLPIRIEFTGYQTGEFPGISGTGNKSSVQFYSLATTSADFGVSYPNDYCQIDPKVIAPFYLSGNSTIELSASKALLSTLYSATGETPTVGIDATQGQIGTVYGVAYDRSTKKAYMGTFLKRHSGLGPLGIGGLYQVNYSSGTPVVSSFLDLEAAPFNIDFGSISSNVARGLLGTGNPSQDVDAFGKVLKHGMGGVELSDDGSKLYVVNLFLRNITVIDLTAYNATGAAITAANISTLNLPVLTCTNGVARPLGLKYYKGKLFLSVTCTAELAGGTIANMVGYVYAWDGTTWGLQLTVPINLPLWGNVNPINALELPVVWSDNPSTFVDANADPTVFAVDERQPMVADIEIEDNGAMIVGIMDRTVIQFATFNHYPGSPGVSQISFANGDIMRAAYNGATYTMENGGVSGGLIGCGAQTNNNYPYAGPGGGEFYCGDTWVGAHIERSLGGLGLVSGKIKCLLQPLILQKRLIMVELLQ